MSCSVEIASFGEGDGLMGGWCVFDVPHRCSLSAFCYFYGCPGAFSPLFEVDEPSPLRLMPMAVRRDKTPTYRRPVSR